MANGHWLHALGSLQYTVTQAQWRRTYSVCDNKKKEKEAYSQLPTHFGTAYLYPWSGMEKRQAHHAYLLPTVDNCQGTGLGTSGAWPECTEGHASKLSLSLSLWESALNGHSPHQALELSRRMHLLPKCPSRIPLQFHGSLLASQGQLRSRCRRKLRRPCT